jgi:hypothetical protein
MKPHDAYVDRFTKWVLTQISSDRFDRICIAFLCACFGYLIGLIQQLAR